MCRFRDPTGHKPNSISNGLPNPYPHGETASPANTKGTLRKLAKIANDVSVSRKLHQDLLQAKVGTNRIERDAFNQVKARKFGRIGDTQGSKTQQIREGRDPKIVSDFLELKIGHISNEEKEIKENYKTLKKQVKEELKVTAYKRLIRSIARATEKSWKKGLKDNQNKVEFLTQKYKINVDTHQGCKCREVFEQMCITRGQEETFKH